VSEGFPIEARGNLRPTDPLLRMVGYMIRSRIGSTTPVLPSMSSVETVSSAVQASFLYMYFGSVLNIYIYIYPSFCWSPTLLSYQPYTIILLYFYTV